MVHRYWYLSSCWLTLNGNTGEISDVPTTVQCLTTLIIYSENSAGATLMVSVFKFVSVLVLLKDCSLIVKRLYMSVQVRLAFGTQKRYCVLRMIVNGKMVLVLYVYHCYSDYYRYYCHSCCCLHSYSNESKH